jgi:hypothetical protein
MPPINFLMSIKLKIEKQIFIFGEESLESKKKKNDQVF